MSKEEENPLPSLIYRGNNQEAFAPQIKAEKKERPFCINSRF